jgi:hypothetical protein
MLAFVIAGVLSQVLPLDKVEVPVNNMRPSTLLRALNPKDHLGASSLIPEGMSVSYDDERSVIILVSSNRQQVQEVRNAIALFDVAKLKLATQVNLKSPLDKFTTSATIEMTNNLPWTMSQPSLGIELTLTPRVNGDGTVTIFAEVKESEPATYRKGGWTSSMAFRVKNGERFGIQLDSRGVISEAPGVLPATKCNIDVKPFLTPLTFSITPKIIERGNSASYPARS